MNKYVLVDLRFKGIQRLSPKPSSRHGYRGCFGPGATQDPPVVPETQDEQKPQGEELSRDAQSRGPYLGVSAPDCRENKNDMANPIQGGCITVHQKMLRALGL